jgi:predicted nucleotidyltransferase
LLNPDFRDMLSALSDERAEFLLVGAYALAVYGLPRATGDMDLWIRCSDDNAGRVWRALARFGAPLGDLRQDDLRTPGVVVQIGVVPRRIDLLTSIDAVEFDDAWAQKTEVELEGLRLPVIGRRDLIANKKAVGRPQDLADVARLESEPPADAG